MEDSEPIVEAATTAEAAPAQPSAAEAGAEAADEPIASTEAATGDAEAEAAEGAADAGVKAHPLLDRPLDDDGVVRAEMRRDKLRAERQAKMATRFNAAGFRIMRENTDAVVSSGINPFDEAEMKKKEARAKKFGTKLVRAASDTEGMLPEEEDPEEAQKRKQREFRAKKFGIPLVDHAKVEEHVLATDIHKILEMTPAQRHHFLKLDETDARHDPDPCSVQRDDALHLYGFMPVGNPEIMKKFQLYGIRTVEWISATSCNIVFADATAAARALSVFGSDFPDSLASCDELRQYGWKVGPTIVKKKKDKWGRPGDEAKLLIRYATEEDVKHWKPRPARPPTQSKKKRRRRRRDDEVEMEDAGGMEEGVMEEPGGGGGGMETEEVAPRRKKQLRTGKRGNVMFNADGSISLVRSGSTAAGEDDAAAAAAGERAYAEAMAAQDGGDAGEVAMVGDGDEGTADASGAQDMTAGSSDDEV